MAPTEFSIWSPRMALRAEGKASEAELLYTEAMEAPKS